MAGLDRGHDAELEQLFRGEPELLELGERLRAARPEPVLDPRFKAVLRSRVMDAAERELGRRPVLLRRPWFLRVGPLALSGGLGAAMVAGAVAALLLYHPVDEVTSPTASSTASGVARLDPNSVIRVSFTRPMDRATVLRGLEIRPATAYAATWSQGDTLLTIAPTHHLAANTAYTVTIAHGVARDAGGRAPKRDIQVSFGTATTPSPVATRPVPPAADPVFALTPLAPVAPGSHLDLLPDGSVVSGGAQQPASGSPGPSASQTSPSPAQGSAPSPSAAGASPSPGSGPSPALLRLARGAAPVQLGSGGGRVAVSDDGRLVASLVPAAGGGATLNVVDAAGGQPTSLGAADSSDGPLVWAASDTIEYVGGGRLRAVNLQGTSRTLTPGTVSSGQTVALASGGHTAYLGPTAAQPVGQLVDLGSLQGTPLPGASTQVVFSGDGTRVAWVDHSQRALRVLVAAVSDPAATTTVATLHGADGVSGIALSAHGRRVAVAHSSGALRAVEVATNQLLASTTLTLDGDLAWASSGDRIAAVRHDGGGDVLVVATLPGTGPAPAFPDQVPSAAAAALNSFLTAQSGSGTGDLSSLVAPGVATAALRPAGLTRYYVIRAAVNPDGSVAADVRVVADAGAGAPVRSATESVSLSQTGGSWLVASVTLGALRPEASGPQVVHVSSARSGGQTTLQLSFDSDLDPGSVPGAITVQGADGSTLDVGVTYDADTRTIVAVVSAGSAAPLHLQVGTQLRDVNGQHLAGRYLTQA